MVLMQGTGRCRLGSFSQNVGEFRRVWDSVMYNRPVSSNDKL